jgi:hypothetical protein
MPWPNSFCTSAGGRIRQSYRESQEDQLGAVDLVLTLCVKLLCDRRIGRGLERYV